MAAILGFTVAALKVCCPWMQQERMCFIIQSLMEDWSSVGDNRSRQIMSQYAFWGRLAFTAQIIPAAVIALEFSITRAPSLTSDTFRNNSLSTHNLLVGPSCWIPDTMPMSLYLLHYFLVFFGLYSAILIFPGCDAFVFSVVLHLCGQFEVLNQSFENVPHDESDLDHKRRIREYSRRHNKLLTLGNELNDLVSLIIFSELFSNGMVICLSGIVILSNIKRGNVSDDDINYGVRIYIWYCELFMYSYVGEQLASQSEKIQKTIYGCPWYSMSVNTAKEIKFIMMRNNSFCYLTAGGILVMNYETFKDITRIMFSSCSVLKLILE
ncbi:odorant receptor 22c-like isoform X2 [Diachasmimorpha longicaudata]